jgi:hypothetical protein
MPVAVPAKITALLTALTTEQVRALSPADRQRLTDQCQRVLRLAQIEKIVDRARQATEGAKAAFFSELRDGRGRE